MTHSTNVDTETGSSPRSQSSKSTTDAPNWESKSQPLPSVTHAVADLSGRPKLVFTVLGAVVALVALSTFLTSRKTEREESARDVFYLAKKNYETELKDLAKVETRTRPMSAALAESLKAAQSADQKSNEKALEKGKTTAKGESEKTATPPVVKDYAKEKEDRHIAEISEVLAYEKLDVDAKFPKTLASFNEVMSKHSGTQAAFEAALSAGNLFFDHRSFSGAAKWFGVAVTMAKSPLDKVLAHSSLGYAQENSDQREAAAKSFELALVQAQGAIKADLLLALARVKSGLGDTTRAKNLYDSVMKDFAGTEFAKAAEEKKARLK